MKQGPSYVFTLIQKFKERDPEPYSRRSDIIVIADEAHRTQYGKLSENMRDALPNASFFAFTGTPLMDCPEDHLTRRVFGDYISVYDFQRAVQDNATVPLFYDNRGEKLGITTPDMNEHIAAALEDIELDQDGQAKLQRELAREYPILTAPERLERIAEDLVFHLSERWLNGKALLVCLDKITCVKMFELVSEKWQEEINRQITRAEQAEEPEDRRAADAKLEWLTRTQIRVIVSEEQNEVDKFRRWRDVENAGLEQRGEARRWVFDIEQHRRVMKQNECDAQFKDEEHPFRLAIVCAMWLTGFDVPSLSTLYLDKPMKGHTLMQAIARANRVHEGKNNGLLVDYNGMLKGLREALAKYGQASTPGSGGSAGGGEPDMEALAAIHAEAVQACVDHLFDCGFDLAKLVEAKGFEKLALLDKANEASAVNAVCTSDETRARFEVLTRDMFNKRKALLGRADLVRPHAPRFDAIEIVYKRLQDNREAADITEVIVALYGVVGEHLEVTEKRAPGAASGNLYDISKIDFDRLRRELARSSTKNTVVQNLKDAIAKKLRRMIQRNPLRVDFHRKYMEIIAEYNRETDRATIEQTFETLLDLVKALGDEEQRIVRERLDEEQAALFDLIVQHKDDLPPRARNRVKDVCRELLAAVKAELARLDDWRAKEQTQAQVRSLILDFLYADETGLPEELAESEIEELANVIFLHVHTQYESAAQSPYVEVA